jgi:transposase-like protein
MKAGPDQKRTAEFREAAVRQVLDGARCLPQVARSLQMSARTLANWVARARPAPALRRSVESTQYAAGDDRKARTARGITVSMSRRGDCRENERSEFRQNERSAFRARRARAKPGTVRRCRPSTAW